MRTAVILMLLHASAVADTGRITGTVKVTDAKGKKVAGAVVVVYVIGPPSTPAPENAPPATIAQRDRKFVPDLLAITVGDSVAFPNEDKGYHNVFSSKPKFDLGTRSAKEVTKPQTFTKTGVIDVYCNIHPDEAAKILVLPNRHHTTTTSGAFALEDVPIGDWAVYAFVRNAEKPATKPVKVTTTGGSVNLAIRTAPESPHMNKFGGKYNGQYPNSR